MPTGSPTQTVMAAASPTGTFSLTPDRLTRLHRPPITLLTAHARDDTITIRSDPSSMIRDRAPSGTVRYAEAERIGRILGYRGSIRAGGDVVEIKASFGKEGLER